MRNRPFFWKKTPEKDIDVLGLNGGFMVFLFFYRFFWLIGVVRPLFFCWFVDVHVTAENFFFSWPFGGFA